MPSMLARSSLMSILLYCLLTRSIATYASDSSIGTMALPNLVILSLLPSALSIVCESAIATSSARWCTMPSFDLPVSAMSIIECLPIEVMR